MKKFLLGGIALAALMAAAPAGAADMRAPAYKAPPPPAPMFTWTGFYIGGHVGAGWGDKHWYSGSTAPGLDQGFHHVGGGLGGGQIGFNYQVSNWVLGIEADYSAANLTGRHTDVGFTLFGADEVNRSQVKSVATVAGRLGYAWDRVLVYAKGGGAWARDKYVATNVLQPDAELAGASETRSGWMAGLGLEYAFAHNWSVKFEYDYLDLGTKRSRFTGPTLAVPFDEDIAQKLSLFKIGINYRFGGYGPVYANY
jgi:outer membrane immunogenic protein